MDELKDTTGFEWDEGNIYKNFIKHYVTREECEEVLTNNPETIRSHHTEEERYIAFGQTDNLRKLAIIFTIRNKKIRVISARPQSKKERSNFNG